MPTNRSGAVQSLSGVVARWGQAKRHGKDASSRSGGPSADAEQTWRARLKMRGEQTVYEVITTDVSRLEPTRRFGRLGKPIPTTEAYRRVVSTLLRNGIRVEKWILINERDQIVTHVTTYNGITGAHFDAVQNTHWLSWDTLRPRLEDYKYVPTDECPVANPVKRLSQTATGRARISQGPV